MVPAPDEQVVRTTYSGAGGWVLDRGAMGCVERGQVLEFGGAECQERSWDEDRRQTVRRGLGSRNGAPEPGVCRERGCWENQPGQQGKLQIPTGERASHGSVKGT